MKLKPGKKKIDIVLGKGISSNLDLLRKNVKTKFKFDTLVQADEFIAFEFKKFLDK